MSTCYREQPDNIKSVNLVAETSHFLALLYGSINKSTVSLVCELFQTLVEFVSVSTKYVRSGSSFKLKLGLHVPTVRSSAECSTIKSVSVALG